MNRSSQFDRMRLGWKLITIEGLSVNEVWTLMDTANPHDPWSTAWSHQTSNGQHH